MTYEVVVRKKSFPNFRNRLIPAGLVTITSIPIDAFVGENTNKDNMIGKFRCHYTYDAPEEGNRRPECLGTRSCW